MAGGFEVPDESAVAGAMGGTGTARRGDPASAWYNPSETADGSGFRGGLGILLAIPTIGAEAIEEPARDQTTSSVSPPPHLHLSYSENEWAIGLYAGLSHGTSVSWPEGWWGRFESLGTGILGIRVAPFFALRLGGEHGLLRDFPDFRISIGAHVDVVRQEIRRALDFIDREGRVHLLMWGAGVGGDASLYWQATEELSFGFTYKSRTWMRLSGDADFTVPEPFLGRAADQRVSSELVIPDRLALGAAWQQREFGVFADVTISLWSVRDRLVIDFERPATSDIDSPQRWRDTASFRLGGEVAIIPEIRVRAGGFYDMEAAPADTLAPTSPDMARVGVSLGGGFDITPELGVDVYYSFVSLLAREATGPDAPLARYAGDLHLVGLTLRLVVGGPSATASEPPAEPADADSPDADSPDADSPDAESADADSHDADSPDADSPDADSPEPATRRPAARARPSRDRSE